MAFTKVSEFSGQFMIMVLFFKRDSPTQFINYLIQ